MTFQGTEKQIDKVLAPLSLLPVNQIDFMKKALRSNLNDLMVETRVYIIDLHKANSIITPHDVLTDEEFIDIAESQGYVYSIGGFTNAFNSCELDSIYKHSAVRFINIKV